MAQRWGNLLLGPIARDKFMAMPETIALSLADKHVLVKFGEKLDSPVSQLWRDLWLAEHLALRTLRQAACKEFSVDF